MLSLKKCLKDVLGSIKTLKEKSNKYYKVSAKVSNKAGNSIIVCTLSSLPKGIYLVLGNVISNVDAGASSLMVADTKILSGAEMLADGQGRSTMNAGGGCHAWALVEVTAAKGSVVLTTYGYYSGSCTYTGVLTAIKLI